MQRRFQIDPKWCPADSWVTPGSSLGPPLSLPGSPPGWFPDASKDSGKKWWILGGSRHVLGGHRGPTGNPNIRKKTIFCSKRAFQTWFFDDVRTDNRLHVFRVIWHRFSTKKKPWENDRKNVDVLTASLAFLNKATLTKRHVLRYERYSFIFRVAASFS